MLTSYFERYASEYAPYKGGGWCYEDGCLYRGLGLLHDATGDARWLGHVERLAGRQVAADGTLAGYRQGDYNIDNVMPGRTLLRLHRAGGDGRYLRAAETLAGQLATHPRTRSGVYWHKLRYPWQVWLDGLYMGLPFQVEYGRLTGDDAMVRDALAQLATALALTFCPETGLYSHGCDESRTQAWADPETGRSPAAHWGRALGWLSMALVDVAEMVGEELDEETAGAARRLLRRLVELRRPEGLWLQVVDRPDLAGNYVETSASAMFAYALLKGRRLGLVELAPGVAAEIGRAVISVVRPGAGRAEHMPDICEVAGLGEFQGRYRDGTADYYLSEARVSDDVKGVGPLMMAAAEVRLGGVAPEGLAQRV